MTGLGLSIGNTPQPADRPNLPCQDVQRPTEDRRPAVPMSRVVRMSHRLVRAEASVKRIRRVALLLLALSVVFGLLLVANIVVLLIISGDRTVLVVQVGILAVLTLLFDTGAWALQRIASGSAANDPS